MMKFKCVNEFGDPTSLISPWILEISLKHNFDSLVNSSGNPTKAAEVFKAAIIENKLPEELFGINPITIQEVLEMANLKGYVLSDLKSSMNYNEQELTNVELEIYRKETKEILLKYINYKYKI